MSASLLRSACILLALGLVQGCSTRVTVHTDPKGGTFDVFELRNGKAVPVPEQSYTNLPDGSTVELSFKDVSLYRIVAKQRLYNDKFIDIAKPAESASEVTIKLDRYGVDVPTLGFLPQQTDLRTWVLVPSYDSKVGMLDISESSPGTAKSAVLAGSLSQITNSGPKTDGPGGIRDVRACVMSPTADVLVYQLVTENVLSDTPYETPEIKDDKKQVGQTLTQISAAKGVSVAELVRDNRSSLPTTDPNTPLPGKTRLSIVKRELTSLIWKQVIDRPIVTPLLRSSFLMTHPGFTFGGEAVLFAADNVSPNAMLWRMQLDGGGTRMTKLTTTSDSLEFAPSGGQEYITFTALPRGSKRTGVWLAKPDGTEPSIVTDDGESPSISSTGDRILFLRAWTDGRKSVKRIYVMNINGGDQTELTHNIDYDVADPRWSPDGKYIVYASNAGKQRQTLEPNFDIWLMRADGQHAPLQLTTNGSHDDSPSFDRTGRFVYFRSNRGGQWNVWRFELNTAAFQELGG